MEFDDNRLAAMIYGEHDRHLILIEAKLGVRLQNRGNRLRVLGGAGAVAAAQDVLDRLYREARKGREISTPEVDAALRFASRKLAAVEEVEEDLDGGGASIRTRKQVVKARSPGQVDYIRSLHQSQMVFGLGPAGTGKTFLAVAMAVSRLASGQVDRIILSRPAVEAGERLGFLPGDLREKVDPYLRPLYDALYDTMPGDEVLKRFERGDIEVAPLAYMRGRTLANCFVILDEAQNTTPMQMKMFLTRFGENCQMVICGDPSQTDLPRGTRSGLVDALHILEKVEGIDVVRFTKDDVVRHPLVGSIVEAYDRADAADRARLKAMGHNTESLT
ncbi:PhoH family protein [Alphaproteobacteria bacterium LMG 31809]|uniref:PhoH-like protein n=2 Tax=Govanella unica TaxID=2975056 RepID=A0A9X3Z7Z1_9PROT|nr:PhoH family protein [Govania unica]